MRKSPFTGRVSPRRRFAIAFMVVLFGVLSSSAVASAACDARIGSQFSKSNPNISLTANSNGQMPGHILVGGLSWSLSGGLANLGGGYWNQHYSFSSSNSYVVNHVYQVVAQWTSGAGDCSNQQKQWNITAVA